MQYCLLHTVWSLAVQFLADLRGTCSHCESLLQLGAWWRLTSGFLSQQAFCFVSTGVQAHRFGDHLAPVLFYTREHRCYTGHVCIGVTGGHSKAFVPGSESRDCAIVTESWLLNFSSASRSSPDWTSPDTLDSNNAICGHNKAQPLQSLARLMQVQAFVIFPDFVLQVLQLLFVPLVFFIYNLFQLFLLLHKVYLSGEKTQKCEIPAVISLWTNIKGSIHWHWHQP